MTLFSADTLLGLCNKHGAMLEFDGQTGFSAGGALIFQNGFTISVRWGKGNYSENRAGGIQYPKNAETAVISPNGKFVTLPGDVDEVQGWQSFENVDTLCGSVKEWSGLDLITTIKGERIA